MDPAQVQRRQIRQVEIPFSGQIEALDRPKLLRDVTEVIADHGGNIQAASSATGRDRVAILRFEIQFSDPQQLDRVIAEARRVDGVFDAYRLVPQTG